MRSGEYQERPSYLPMIEQRKTEDHSRESTPISPRDERNMRNSHTDMKMEKACAPVTEQDHEESPRESATKSFNQTGIRNMQPAKGSITRQHKTSVNVTSVSQSS